MGSISARLLLPIMKDKITMQRLNLGSGLFLLFGGGGCLFWFVLLSLFKLLFTSRCSGDFITIAVIATLVVQSLYPAAATLELFQKP